MKETGGSTTTTAPTVQRIVRKHTLDKEHKDALERAVSLNVPHAVNSMEEEASRQEDETQEPPPSKSGDSSTKTKPASARTSWDEVVEKLFHRNKTGDLLLRKDVVTSTDEAPLNLNNIVTPFFVKVIFEVRFPCAFSVDCECKDNIHLIHVCEFFTLK